MNTGCDRRGVTKTITWANGRVFQKMVPGHDRRDVMQDVLDAVARVTCDDTEQDHGHKNNYAIYKPGHKNVCPGNGGVVFIFVLGVGGQS